MKRREPAPVGGASLLERGRAALAGRAWSEAYEAFTAAASAADADTFEVADLEAYALAAAMVGLVDEQLRLLERVYEVALRQGEELPAARSAFWLGMRLFSVGEPARGNAWMARAHRLAEGKDCPERGYLLLPAMRRLEAAGDAAGAAAAVAEAEALGDRFHDADLSAFARSFHGRLLLRQGRVEEGLALLDEAMLAATSGGLSPVVTGLTYCACIAACHQIFALDRGREWTAALAAWCEAQPQLATFTGQCRVHRSELLVLGGAWPDAIVEAEHVARPSGPPTPARWAMPTAAATGATWSKRVWRQGRRAPPNGRESSRSRPTRWWSRCRATSDRAFRRSRASCAPTSSRSTRRTTGMRASSVRGPC